MQREEKMEDQELHETMKKEVEALQRAICLTIGEWEQKTGVYVTNVDYHKDKVTIRCLPSISLILDRGVR